MHLAELNIARLKHDLDDPRVADFVNNLDLVNGIAERSPGFVWRYKDDTGAATDTRVLDDPRVIVNLSVWETVADLEAFVWKTVHKRFYELRDEWFQVMEHMHFTMWWVPEGHKPTVEEAMARLEHHNTNGSTDHAFGWEHLTDARLWRSAQCDRTVA